MKPILAATHSHLRTITLVLLLIIASVRLPAEGAAPAENYQLQPMDLLRVQVFQEPDLDREVRVSRSYSINLPLIGNVKLQGRTLRDAERMITALYRKDYLVNPQINVTVIEYSPRVINVLGAVNAPGPVPIPPESNLTVLEAITRTGGFARIANRNKIVITRTDSDGNAENYVVDGDELMRGAAEGRWLLQAGDVIFVPESIL